MELIWGPPPEEADDGMVFLSSFSHPLLDTTDEDDDRRLAERAWGCWACHLRLFRCHPPVKINSVISRKSVGRWCHREGGKGNEDRTGEVFRDGGDLINFRAKYWAGGGG